MSQRILVVGASGLVGAALLEGARWLGEPVGTFHHYAVEGLVPLDISDVEAVDALTRELPPQVILQPGALTNVDYCETNPDEAWRINVEGTRHLAAAAARHGAKHVFFSSDYVFDGTAGPYAEDDPPNPTSVYGRTKLAAEQVVRETAPDHLIVRTTVVYGWEQQGKNFIMRLIRTLGQGERVSVPEDQVGSPTYNRNLAEAVLELLTLGRTGTYHVAGCQLADRYRFALAAARVFCLRPDLLLPVRTVDLNQAALRPLQGGLNVDKAARELKTPLLGYQQGLETMKKERPG
jgi:dTDP-4-dehydrorhamnose reductase